MTTYHVVTIGYVIQTFDEETNQCIGQVFIASDESSYEDDFGNGIDERDHEAFPFEMKQPGQTKE